MPKSFGTTPFKVGRLLIFFPKSTVGIKYDGLVTHYDWLTATQRSALNQWSKTRTGSLLTPTAASGIS
jgi:hypothetical protein